MDIKQCDYEIGVGRVDLLMIDISLMYIAERIIRSQESQSEESL